MSKDMNTYQGFAAFHGQVNIELFNDIIEFVSGTSAENHTVALRELEYSHLWYSRTHNENIQQKYGFRYLGELLERFEERHGSDIADIRAIALALAYAKDLLTDDMFVGSQKGDFISKVVKLSDSDIYLKGSLYRLGLGEYNVNDLLNDIIGMHYIETEQLIFAVSLNDNFEKAFVAFKPQLIRLLGTERSIVIGGNTKIFCWFIKMLLRCPQIKTMRTKDMALFRALMELPVSFVKEGSRHHGILLGNGYTALDIIYLNSSAVRFRPTRDAIDTKSIVAEKIAVEMCTTFINSNETHSPHIYEHLEWLLNLYETFVIKLGGYSGIYKAIKHSLKITNPQTFIWLFNQSRKKDSDYYGYRSGELPDSLFSFDIMDTKWDVLCSGLDKASYRHLFDMMLQVDSHKMQSEQVEERINKYNVLTSQSYLEQFTNDYSWRYDSIFSIVVSKGIVDLVTAFEACEAILGVKDDTPDGDRPAMLQYIKNHIKGIGSREAFEFFRYFLCKYSFDEMDRLFTEKKYYGNRENFFSEPLYKGPARNHGDKDEARFKIKRSFLSDDEHRELFGWLDDFMFQYKSNEYTEFVMLTLADNFITTLYPKELLRIIFDMIKDSSIWDEKPDSDTRAIKDKYFSEAELQVERDAVAALKVQREQQAREDMLQELKNEIANNYDGSFFSIYKFMNRHNWKTEDDALALVIDYCKHTLVEKSYVLGKEDCSYFLSIGSKLYRKGKIALDDLKNHISKIEESEEETKDAKND